MGQINTPDGTINYTPKPEKNSHEWYEQVYHAPKNMPPFMEYIQSAVDRGYKKRFDEVMKAFEKEVDISVDDVLEIGGHLGKTALWLLEWKSKLCLDIIDFSQPAVEYMRKNIGKRAHLIWKDKVDCIHTDEMYDLITCIDVAEHLDDTTFRGMLVEIAACLRSIGYCIFMGSMATHNAHTNIRNPATIIKDADGLLKFVKMLPHNHILFRGI